MENQKENGWRRAELRSPSPQSSEGRSGRGGGEGSGALAPDEFLKKSAGKGAEGRKENGGEREGE